MIDRISSSVLTGDIDSHECDEIDCDVLAESLLNGWRNGESIDAIEVLKKYSLIRRNQSLAVDLAYEEFCLRHSRGEKIDVAVFCDKFPEIRRSLERQIEFHKLIEDNPDVLKNFTKPSWPAIGSVFLGFRIRKEVGRGAFARVYLASEIALGDRDVVVKVSTVGTNEAKTLGKLSHPSIVPVHSVFEDPSSNLTAMCMPSLGEATLHDLVTSDGHLHSSTKLRLLDAFKQRRPVKPSSEWLNNQYTRSVLHFGVKLASALSFAHKGGVLHLDLKPSNILITADGEPMLLDFNLSRDVTQDPVRIGGTLPYMSPEQLVAFVDQKYDVHPTSVLSDVYGFGVILFQLLRGELPFTVPMDTVESLNETARRHIRLRQAGSPAWLKCDLKVRHSICKLISDCLEFDPYRRPSSMQVILLRLQSELSLSNQVRNWVFRQRRAVVAAGILCLTLPFTADERPAYRSRLVARAIVSYENRHFDRVIDQTSKILASDNANRDALLLQCLALAQKRDYIRAMQAFKESRTFITDPRIMAVGAHCFAASKHHDDAIGWYLHAISAGLESNAHVHNNLGFSLMQRGRLDEAINQFNNALLANPSHTASLHNYAIAELKMTTRTGQYSPRPVLLIQQAISTSEPSWELERDAAWIYAWAEQEHHIASDGAVIRHLRRALQLGIEKHILAEDPVLSTYFTTLVDSGLGPKETVNGKRPATRVHDHRDILLQIQVRKKRQSSTT